jgi:quinol monooxygenase YgiN
MGSSTVRMTLRWHVPIGRSRSVTAALHTLMVAARSEPGFVFSSVSADINSLAGVQYIEEWVSEDHLRRMLISDHFAQIAALSDDAISAPSVSFALPAGIRGIDYLDEVRDN